MKTKTAYQFFLKHAGYSYDPTKETRAQGRRRCARLYAKAERAALEGGFSFDWSVDPHSDSSDWSDETPPYEQWQCVMYNSDGRIVSSLHGIDFGRDKTPFESTYKRVVESELAVEGIDNTPQ